MATLGISGNFGGMPKQAQDENEKVAETLQVDPHVDSIQEPVAENLPAVFDYFSPAVPGLGIGDFVFINGRLRLGAEKANEFEDLLTKLDLRTRALVKTPKETGGIAPALPNLVGRISQIADSATLFNPQAPLRGTVDIAAQNSGN